MITIQTYECPTHGRLAVPIEGDAPDTVRCVLFIGCSAEGEMCGEWAEWRPSAPNVVTQETRVKSLKGLARTSNPL
jgi:hypothetical protein